MEAIVILLSLYVVYYVFLIVQLWYAYGYIKPFKQKNKVEKIGFSIIIPFRNEQKHLPALLASFTQLDYPADLMEFIFIDDQSTDNSAAIINSWRLSQPNFQTTMIDNIRLSASPKKDAIVRAIPIAMHPWIATTDADCEVPASWLILQNDFIAEHNMLMVCGPVKIKAGFGLLSLFQQTDLLALQGVTIGAFGLKNAFMCNAANMAFSKAFFTELGGFGGVSNFASGDDVLLLQKAYAAKPNQVGYIKARKAAVVTQPITSLFGLLMQRIRWASKAKNYISEYGQTLALTVFFGNFALVLAALLSASQQLPWEFTAALFTIKFLVDYALAARTNYLLQQRILFFPVLTGIVYPFICIFIAICTLYGKYYWKGRKLA